MGQPVAAAWRQTIIQIKCKDIYCTLSDPTQDRGSKQVLEETSTQMTQSHCGSASQTIAPSLINPKTTKGTRIHPSTSPAFAAHCWIWLSLALPGTAQRCAADEAIAFSAVEPSTGRACRHTYGTRRSQASFNALHTAYNPLPLHQLLFCCCFAVLILSAAVSARVAAIMQIVRYTDSQLVTNQVTTPAEHTPHIPFTQMECKAQYGAISLTQHKHNTLR